MLTRLLVNVMLVQFDQRSLLLMIVAFDCRGVRLPLVGDGGRLEPILNMLLSQGLRAVLCVCVRVRVQLVGLLGFAPLSFTRLH